MARDHEDNHAEAASESESRVGVEKKETAKTEGPLNIETLKEMRIQQLSQIAKDLEVPSASGLRKQELIFQILKSLEQGKL